MSDDVYQGDYFAYPGRYLVYDSDFRPTDFFGLTQLDRHFAQRVVTHSYDDICLVKENGLTDASCFRVYDRLDEPAKGEFPISSAKVLRHDNSVFVLNGHSPMALSKLDLQLNPIWQREFDNQGGGMPNQQLFYYQNSIIALLRSFRLDDKDADIVALDEATGDILWQQHLPYLIEFFHLAGDRLYLSSQLHGYWCVLCAKTGDILLQQQVEGNEDDIIRCRYLWPFDGYLLLHNGFDSLTVIDQTNGEHLADIDIPPEFALSHVPPKVIDDYVYVMLGAGGDGMQFSYAGVMALSRERLRQGSPYTVDVEPYLGVSHSAVADGDTDYYDIQISCAELGDVLRFGQIEMRKVAQRHSYNFFGNMDKNVKQRVNKRFNGRLQLSIDRAALNNPDDSKIDLLVQLYNQHYQNGFVAPATRKPLSVSWRYV